MDVVGYVAVGVVGLCAAYGAFWAMRSIPDINRYRRLRKM